MSKVPVASQEYLTKHGQPQEVEQLLTHHLIHQRSKSGWEQWLSDYDVNLPSDAGGVVIEDANVVVRTAISGQGIALGWLPLIEDEIASGKLVQLFEKQPGIPLCYHLIKSSHGSANPMAEMVKWLIGESDQLAER